MEAETRTSTAKAANEFNKIDRSIGSSFGHRAGQLSHQVQDIAVQLQSGTRAATVFAQQGSQIASIFGPHGAIIGGVLAIGAGIYTWASGIKEADEAAKGLMAGLKQMQSFNAGMRKGTEEDREIAAKANILGSRRELPLLKREFEQDMRRLEKEFEELPIHRRDEGVFEERKKARRERFDAEKGQLDEKFAEEHDRKARADEKAEADKAKREEENRIRELRQFERQQLDDFYDHRRDQQEKFADMQEREIERVSQFEKDKTKFKDLSAELNRERAKKDIDRDAAEGEALLRRAEEAQKPLGQRRAEGADRRRGERALRREISGDVDRADMENRRHGGTGLTDDEKNAIRQRKAGQVEAAKNKDKMKAEIDGDSIQKLTDAINKLLTK